MKTTWLCDSQLQSYSALNFVLFFWNILYKCITWLDHGLVGLNTAPETEKYDMNPVLVSRSTFSVSSSLVFVLTSLVFSSDFGLV